MIAYTGCLPFANHLQGPSVHRPPPLARLLDIQSILPLAYASSVDYSRQWSIHQSQKSPPHCKTPDFVHPLILGKRPYPRKSVLCSRVSSQAPKQPDAEGLFTVALNACMSALPDPRPCALGSVSSRFRYAYLCHPSPNARHKASFILVTNSSLRACCSRVRRIGEVYATTLFSLFSGWLGAGLVSVPCRLSQCSGESPSNER